MIGLYQSAHFLRFIHLLFQIGIEATRIKIINYRFIAIFTGNNYFSNDYLKSNIFSSKALLSWSNNKALSMNI